MKASESRILTTHAGSLPRPKRLVELFVAKSRRQAVDETELAREIADCGFSVSAGLGEVAEEVVWKKLRVLRAGADLATDRLLS